MTGRNNAESQLQVATGMLLESVSDKSQVVVEAAQGSVRKLAERHPNQVLNSCCQFCVKATKPGNGHVADILEIMRRVCVEHILELDGDTILGVIDFCLKVMVETPGYEPGVQMPAAEVLVALGRKHYVQVMDSLLKKLEAGTVPHYMIPHTLGALANANAFGVIPYLKNILSIILPMLGAVKFDPPKQAFAHALGSFCEALIEYTANLEQAPDNTITVEAFQVEMGAAFDVLFFSWLTSREVKVTESVLSALSSILPVLNVEKTTQQTPKVVQTLLNLYKRHVDAYHVTRCLGAIIQKASSVNGTLLEPLLNNVLQALSDSICVSPDYAQPDSLTLKNHSEALRCYECLALHFTDSTIDQLVSQLKNNNERERVKAILVVTHLTSYSTEQAIQRRFKDIVRHLGELLSDPNIRVKKAMMKIIVAFACKGVLLNKEVNPDGAEKYMEFLLKLCCKPIKSPENDGGELFDVQKTADNTLCMLSTSVPELEPALWHLLMQCFLGCAYDEATVVVLRCLTHLASRKAPSEVSEPAFLRALTLLASPIPGFRGTFLLNFLKNIKPCPVDGYKIVWESKLPQLSKYLEQNYDNFNRVEWQDLVFDFLGILLEAVKDQGFNETLIVTARKQLEMYNNNRYITGGSDPSIKQIEKQFLLKCLAMILCHIHEKEIVLHTLDDILVNVKLTDCAELDACAEAVGICARVHLQHVLDKISLIRRDVLLKKSSKFLHFSFIKDQKHEMGLERVRYVIISGYSEVCNEASSEKLLRVVEAEILDFVVGELTATKDFAIKRACLKAIGSVADAMHPNRNSLHIRMQERDSVLWLVTSQIHLHSGAEYIELFPVVIPVITSLVRLPLPLESEQRRKLLKLCFDHVFNASAIYCRISAESDSYFGDLKLVPFVTSSFTKLNQLVQELLLQNLSPATLDEIVTLLEPWLGRKRAEQRLPAAETLRMTLQTYLDNVKFAYDCPTTFGQTGYLLGKIVPRATDPNKNIRKVAVESLCLVLCIASRYEGRMRDHDKQLHNSLQHVQQQIDSDEPKLLFNLTSDLGHVICLHLPPFQLLHFVDGLADALLDCENSSANGSSVVLNIALKNKGGELQGHVQPIIDKLLLQLDLIRCPRTKATTLRGILSFATHHSKAVCAILLNQALPFSSAICDCWAVLSSDQTLAFEVMDQLKKILKQGALYEEEGENRLANLPPLQALAALHEFLKNPQLFDVCRQNFPEVFSVLLVTLSCYIGVVMPANKTTGDKKEKYFVINREASKLRPAKLALDAFKSFLVCCQFPQCASGLTLTDGENLGIFAENVGGLVAAVCEESPESLSWLVACLGPYIRADLEPQRAAAVAFFAALLKRARAQNVLAENLLEMVLDVQMDQSCLVRKLALRGLGFAAEGLGFDLVARHCHPILSVFMMSLDYNSIGNESDVILEGMLSFSKLLAALEGHKFATCQVTAAVRIKPLLDQDDVSLRRAAFRLLGDLASSLNSEVNVEAFREQVQGNLVTLILHLRDPDLEVIRACKYTLRKVAIYLESPKVNSMVQEHLIDEANLHYADFTRDLVKIMADEMQELFHLFVMTSLSYLKSGWVEVRGSAAMLVGLLFSQMTVDSRQRVSLDTVCDRLMRMASDESEDVRMRAVQAVAYLFVD